MRPRILHIGKFYPPERGGMETHLAELCEPLSRNFDVSALVANRTRAEVRQSINGVNVTRAGMLMQAAGAPLCPAMPRLIRESRPDLVHLHVPNPGGVLSLIASNYRGPLVVTYHSDVVRQKTMNLAFQPVMDHVLFRSAAIISNNPEYATRSAVLQRFVDRCRPIPFGIDIDEVARPRNDSVGSLRSRYTTPIVLAVGRLVTYKGFEYLIRGMKDVSGTLLLVGDGPLRAGLQELSAACGLARRVQFAGEVDDIAPYYQAADVFVLPSISENEAFGIVQLEAMACGKPVINTELPTSVPLVSVHGETGFTVPPRDPAQLAAAINLLLQNESLRQQFGQAARSRVEQHFTSARMVNSVRELYREVLGASTPERQMVAVGAHG